MPSTASRWWRRHADDDTLSSPCQEGQHVAQSLLTNDSLFAEIIDLFILLTPLHSTTFKTEVSTWYIATHVHDHDSVTTWMDVHA